MASIADLIKGLKKLDDQSFRPGDSLIASTINHPVDALSQLGKYLAKQTNTAAGIPDQYDNPYPLLAPSPEAQSQAAFDVAGMAQVGSFPFAPKSAGGTLGSITAWHGSPHKFDKFDMSKIGTGEGAQAYGHGLYFAESPEVATGYREKLAGVNYGGKQIDPSDPYHIARSYVESFKTKEEAIKQLENRALISDYDENMKAASILRNNEQLPEREVLGSLYKTSLEWPDPAREAADPLGPQHFLDWDKPLSEQSEFVRQLLPQDLPQKDWLTGQKIYEGFSGKGSFRNQAEKADFSREKLKELGIPGIRYLDGASRDAGEGSTNYVIFDDQIPKIVERNGQSLQSDNLNAGLLAKYLKRAEGPGGSFLRPSELEEYERNALEMTRTGRQRFNLENALKNPNRQAYMDEFTPAYHGTNADIQEFDYKYTGNGNDQFGSGFYTDTRPNVASGYANGEGAAVYPLMVNIKKPLDSEFEKTLTKKQITDIIKGSPNLKDALYNYDDVDYYGINKVLKDAVNQNHEYQSEKLLDNLHPLNNDFYSGEPEKFSQAVNKATGYDSVKVNFDDGQHLIPWFPNQIRSRFAAFDPLRKDSANLLATRLLPATMLGYGMYNENKKRSLADLLGAQ